MGSHCIETRFRGCILNWLLACFSGSRHCYYYRLSSVHENEALEGAFKLPYFDSGIS